jgi:hypothetical protein
MVLLTPSKQMLVAVVVAVAESGHHKFCPEFLVH